MIDQNDAMEEKFRVYLSTKIPGSKDLVITNFVRLTEGFSYETYLVDVEWIEDNNKTSQGLVIRMVPEAGVEEPYNVEAHYEILKLIEDTPVPAPKAYWLETDSHVLGRPFCVMEKIEGEVRSAGFIAAAEFAYFKTSERLEADISFHGRAVNKKRTGFNLRGKARLLAAV